METMKGKVPNLRFPGFVGEWNNYKISDLFELVSGQHLGPEEYTYERSELNPYFTGPSDFTNDENKLTKWSFSKGKEAYINDILITVKGNGVGALMLLKLPRVTIGRQLMAIRGERGSTELLSHYLETKKQYYESLASGNMIPGLSRSDILDTPICFPDIIEQTKIASFLTAVDDKIHQLTRKKELLEQYKKGVMQKIFNREIRLRDEEGKEYPEWEKTRLGKLTQLFSNRNPKLIEATIYSVTNSNGFVPQNEHFDREVAGKDLSNYKIIERGDFAYNPARINVGSIAYFTEGIGVISSLYVCFRTNKELMDKFLIYFLQLESTKFQINNLGEGGVRIYLWYDLFSLIKCDLPCIKEQQKIASFLSSINQKITLVSQQLEKMQTWKKGLLQKMFV